MRTLLSLVLLLTILGNCLAAQSSYQPKLNPTMTLKEKLQLSHLGSAILNMVTLGQSTDADFEKLFEALAMLKESLLNKKQAEMADFTSDGEVHKQETQRLKRLVNQYTNQGILYQDELDELLAEATELESNLKKQQGQLETAQKAQESEEAMLEKLAEDFDKQSMDYSNAMSLLDQAVQKLQEAKQSQAVAGMFGSFIETNKDNLKSLGEDLNKSLTLLKTSSSYTKPLSQFFVELTNGTPDNSTLDRAIEALNNLKAYFQDGLNKLETNYNNAVSQHTALLNTIKVQVGNLTVVVIPKTQQEIEANTEAQGIRQTLLTEANRNERIEQGNLDAEMESWQKRVDMHELLMPQFDAEYEIVEQAETLLRQQV